VKPLFTIHAGEFVVGDFIEGKFSGVNLWVPTRDTGIDLLATDSKNQKAVSLQVKFSRDYSARHIFQKRLKACGWCALKPAETCHIQGRLLGVCSDGLRPEHGLRCYQTV
jgi:hypothetical protein